MNQSLSWKIDDHVSLDSGQVNLSSLADMTRGMTDGTYYLSFDIDCDAPRRLFKVETPRGSWSSSSLEGAVPTPSAIASVRKNGNGTDNCYYFEGPCGSKNSRDEVRRYRWTGCRCPGRAGGLCALQMQATQATHSCSSRPGHLRTGTQSTNTLIPLAHQSRQVSRVECPYSILRPGET